MVDRSLPHGGIEFGGNDVAPISWPHWFGGAAIAGVGFGCLIGSVVGGASGVAYGGGLGVLLAAVTLAMPIRLRNYRLPEPPVLRVGLDGLHIHVVARQGRRVRTYVYVPWHAVDALRLAGTWQAGLARPALRVELRDGGPGGDGGTLMVPDVGSPDLVAAVAGYSDGRHRVVERQDLTPRVAPGFEVVLYGYDIGQVDPLVRRVEAAMSPDGAASRLAVREELVAGPAFDKRPRGYRRTEVDAYLRRAMRRLAQHDTA
ncbi:DivIVA domain-containing protein [Phytohabitans sp. LJ34]|uniref:DivIVA domain-containing protein n=1 Tax=Phytohabitans sp. LJ34 TaxID=3452217 RepID=UPI003F8CD1D5